MPDPHARNQGRIRSRRAGQEARRHGRNRPRLGVSAVLAICERKKWAEEALAYNGLVIAWPELTKLALAERTHAKEIQQEIF